VNAFGLKDGDCGHGSTTRSGFLTGFVEGVLVASVLIGLAVAVYSGGPAPGAAEAAHTRSPMNSSVVQWVALNLGYSVVPFALTVGFYVRSLVRLKINDIAQGERVMSRAMVVQRKTGQPVQFEITEQAREAISDWVAPGGG